MWSACPERAENRWGVDLSKMDRQKTPGPIVVTCALGNGLHALNMSHNRPARMASKACSGLADGDRYASGVDAIGIPISDTRKSRRAANANLVGSMASAASGRMELTIPPAPAGAQFIYPRPDLLSIQGYDAGVRLVKACDMCGEG